MKILIATPAYNAQVTTTYCESLVGMLSHFRQKHPHIRFERKFLSLSLLPMARNIFANLVMQDESYTHLLFVDADMGFAPSLIEQMIAADKPVVGAMSPARKLDLDTLYALRHDIADPAVARLVAIEYVNRGGIDFVDGTTRDGEFRPASSLTIDGACIRVSDIGTGILLIRREVFDRLRERYPDLWCASIADTYGKFGLTGGVLQCFQPTADENGFYDGEDAAFCRRWVQGCGGEIWAVATETIAHVGTQQYVGNFLTKLQHARF
jgi:hypothetical protein